MVLQHHDRFQLGVVTLFHKLWIADNLLRLCGIQVRVLEEPHTKNVEQQPAGGQFETLSRTLLAIFLAPHLICLDDGTYLVVAAKLVDAGLQDFVVALGLCQMFHAPRFTANRGVEHLHVFGDSPVGTHHALKLRLLAQLPLYHPLAETASYILTRGILPPQDAVDGHHGRGHLGASLQPEGTLHKRALVHGEVVAGIDGILARGEMGVSAALLCAIAIPVLHHRIHTLIPPPFRRRSGLECVAIGTGHIGGQLRVFAERPAETEPTRVGGNVDLRRQGGGDA